MRFLKIAVTLLSLLLVAVPVRSREWRRHTRSVRFLADVSRLEAAGNCLRRCGEPRFLIPKRTT